MQVTHSAKRKAETVLRARTERILLVLEHCSDDLNHVAVMRTCEALGIYRVWLIEATGDDESTRAGGQRRPTGGSGSSARTSAVCL